MWWVLLCPWRLSAWPSLLTAAPGTLSLPESQCVSTSQTAILTQVHSGKPMFRPFVKIFLTKTYCSVHITHSSVSLTWFVLLHHPKEFDDWILFKPRTVCLFWHPFWIASKVIFCGDWNNFCYKPNAEFIKRIRKID